MKPPSTEWREQHEADEESALARFAEQLVEIQKKTSVRYGLGRALHRKPIAALRASFEVLPDLPEPARHGLFATPGRYEAKIRLSNGSMLIQRDRTPDVRGFSIKILGVDGESALGGRTTEQDFLLINRETFGFRNATPFFDVVREGARGPLALVGHMIKTLGLWRGLAEVRRLLSSFSRPFAGFLNDTFYSSAPLQCGPYAVRVRLMPTETRKPTRSSGRFADDVAAELRTTGANFDFQLQFFVDEASTPIEDGTKNWETPYVTVGRLTIPPQDLADATALQLAAAIEPDKFDPWNALAAHKPLGHIMRARKAAYFASQQARRGP